MHAYDVLIRQATLNDAPALARLNALFNDVLEAPEQLARRLTDPQRVETALIAEADRTIVGFAGLRLVPSLFYAEPSAELTELFVEFPYRRRGIARALIAHAEHLAVAGGARELLILTGTNNQAAQALYRAMEYNDYALAVHKKLSD